MKKITHISFGLLISVFTFAQTNTFPTTGNAGIGTTSPQSSLHILSTERNALRLYNPAFTSKYLSLWQGYGAGVIDAIGTGILYVGGYDLATDVIMARSGGNVGIGTSSPDFRLTIGANLNNPYDSSPELVSRGIMTHGIGTGVPYFYLHRDDVTITDGNALGIIKFTGTDGGEKTGALIKSNATGSWSSGNAQASLEFHTTSPGTSLTSMRMIIDDLGNIGVGTADPGEKLEVNGNALIDGELYSKKVKVSVDPGNWPDYVFASSYELRALSELESFVKKNGHLPEVPSAKEVETNGLDLGDMDATLLKKVEELTLYMIEMKKEIEELKKENKRLSKEVKEVKK